LKVQRRHIRLLAFAIFCLSTFGARASDDSSPDLDLSLNERVIYVPVDEVAQVKLQVTLMRPDGAGPFPLAVLNHGKDFGMPRDEKRYRSPYAARYFLSRGYAVAMPMMRGFAGSEGETWVRGCDLERIGLKQAQDIGRVIEYLGRSSDLGFAIDARQVVVSGQSMGGWNTMAVGTLQLPGVKGLVNFAGGINAPSCPSWQRSLVAAAGHYAEQSTVPAIWFYGDNDSRFSSAVWRGMHTNYTRAGRTVELVGYGRFMDDAHNFLGKIEALPVWAPKIDEFLSRVGLPSKNLHPQLLPAPYPLPSQFAAVDDVMAVPIVGDKGREDYQAFLRKERPRVFAISTKGATVMTDGGYDPLDRAQTLCKKNNLRCQVYAVDDDVVWPKPLPIPQATPFAGLDDVGAIPYLNELGRQGYRRFLALPKPRAFVIAPDGAWALSSKDFDVLSSALQACQQGHKECKLYAVDEQVVWPLSPSVSNR
jgi:dienelactone hydrolase